MRSSGSSTSLEQREIDRRIAEGYTRFPQTADENRWAGISGLESIRERALVKSRRGVVGRAPRGRATATPRSHTRCRDPVLTSVLAVPATRTIRGIASEVELGPDDGMPDRCVLSLDHTRVIAKSLFVEPICTLGPERMASVCRALDHATGCR